MQPPSVLPQWLADLPHIAELPNLIAPADGYWESGKAQFGVERRRSALLGRHCRCWYCGYPVSSRRYVIAVEGGAATHHFLYPGPLYVEFGGPAHLSCAFYTAIVCPYLRYATSKARLGRSGHRPRGRAVIVGFDHHGLVKLPETTRVLFGYFGIAEEIPLDDHRTFHAKYSAAVAADAERDFTTTPRLYWTDSPDDTQRLGKMWVTHTTDLSATFAADRSAPVTDVGGHPYRLQPL